MIAKTLKSFKSKNRIYNKEEAISISVDAYLELNKKGLVISLEASEQEKRQIQQAMDTAFAEHFKSLSKLPVSVSKIKENYPEGYKQLKKKEKELDDAFNSLDYGKFCSLLNEIEEGLRELANRRPSYEEIAKKTISFRS